MYIRPLLTDALFKSVLFLFSAVSFIVNDALAQNCLNQTLVSMDEKDFINGKVVASAKDGTQLRVKSGCPDFLSIDQNLLVVVDRAFNIDLVRKLEEEVLICLVDVTCNDSPEVQLFQIYIYDGNDEHPYFNASTPTSLVVSEMMPIGWDLFNFQSSICDDDYEDWFLRKTMTVKISNDMSGAFILNAATKILQLGRTLDYEFGEVLINITLIITDNQGHESKPFIFSVIVADGDDQPPLFTKSHYAISAHWQEWAQGSCLGTTPELLAYDGDVTMNATIEYSIFEINDKRDLAVFDTNCTTKGQLRLVRPIDGSLLTEFQVTIAATQTNARDRVSYSYIHVSVLPPLSMRQEAYRVSLPEDTLPGSLVLTAEAVGQSKASNFSFELYDTTSTFELAPSSGLPYAVIKVSNASRLDREAISSYEMTLICHGLGRENATARISVAVSDINDNAPLFNVSVVNMTLWERELVMGSLILVLEATDIDQGNNANLTLYLSGESAKFFTLVYQKDALGKAVAKVYSSSSMTSGMHRAARTASGIPLFAFDVVAADQGMPSLETRCKVRLFIRPMTPVLLTKVLEVTVTENEHSNATLATIRAEPNIEDANAVFSIFSGNEDGAFEVDSRTGEIRQLKALNREEENVRVLRVNARWAENEEFSGTQLSIQMNSSDLATVLITVIDINEPPYFTHNYSAIVVAKAPANTKVAYVQAFDQDTPGIDNSRLSYFIVKGNDSGLFVIDSLTGEVKTAAALPGGKNAYSMEVLSRDGGVPPLNASTTLLIYSIDDKQPMLLPENETYDVTVIENIAIGSPIIEIKTAIEGNNTGDVRYQLLNTASPFRLRDEKTGVILTDGIIDREDCIMWELVITAYDVSGATSSKATSKITVAVADINDNTPSFSCGNRSIQIVEDEYRMTLLANVTAVDLDEGDNGKIQYRLVQKDAAENLFIVLDGLLYINGSLDYEDRTEHRLIVEASDSGDTPNKATIEVLVLVLDANDFCPVFEALSHQIDVPERTPWHPVALLNATDKDGSVAYNRVVYELRSAALARDFYLDHHSDGSATLRIITGLQFSLNDQYLVTVRARDVADPNCYSDKTLMLRVLKDNGTDSDNVTLPAFDEVVYKIPVAWNATAGDTILELKQTGKTEYIYTIKRGNERHLFTINETSGQIGLVFDAKELGRDTFLLTIAARSPTGAIAEFSAVMYIRIGHPLFRQSVYNAHILEGSRCPLALKLEATPFDATSEVRYTILSGNEDGAFRLDENTGELSCAKELDREKIKFYTLTVTAHQSKAGHFARKELALTGYDSSTLNIWVTDINDNNPQFVSGLEYYIKGYYDANEVVTTFEAIDIDECQDISFGLADHGSGFEIHPNGTLYAKGGQIQRPVTTLNISALDNCDNHGNRTTTSVQLIVMRPHTVTPKKSRWLDAVNKAIEDLEQIHTSILKWNVSVSRWPDSHRQPNKLATSLFAMKEGGLFVDSSELQTELDKTSPQLEASYADSVASKDADNTVVYILAGVLAAMTLLAVIFLSWGCTWRRRVLKKNGHDHARSRDLNAEEGTHISRPPALSTSALNVGSHPNTTNRTLAILVHPPSDSSLPTNQNPATNVEHPLANATQMSAGRELETSNSSAASAIPSPAECEPLRLLAAAADQTRLEAGQSLSAFDDRSGQIAESNEQQETPSQHHKQLDTSTETGERDWPAPPESQAFLTSSAVDEALTTDVRANPEIVTSADACVGEERQSSDADRGKSDLIGSPTTVFSPDANKCDDERGVAVRDATAEADPDNAPLPARHNSATEAVRL